MVINIRFYEPWGKHKEKTYKDKDKEKINYYKNHQIIKEGSKRRIEEENSHKTWRKWLTNDSTSPTISK